MKKTVGILGGMGPEATAYFFGLIIKNTVAGEDRDHIPAVIYNAPQIPDRTRAILYGGPSPVGALVQGIRILKRSGADFIVIPCISAHYFHRRLSAEAGIPVINLLEETAARIRKMKPPVKKIGLMATTGTVASGIFHKAIGKAGIEVLVPFPRDQDRMMQAVYGPQGIKAGFTRGNSRRTILRLARELVDRGADAVIAGCTEIPLVLKDSDLPVPFIDPMLIAARTCIKMAGGLTTGR